MLKANFWKFDNPKTFPGIMRGPTTNLGLIGSAVLTFIGYKQTNKQTNRQTDNPPPQGKWIVTYTKGFPSWVKIVINCLSSEYNSSIFISSSRGQPTIIKGTVHFIFSDPTFIKWDVWCTTVPFQTLILSSMTEIFHIFQLKIEFDETWV